MQAAAEGKSRGREEGGKVLDEGNVRKLIVDYCKCIWRCIQADACIENIRDITNIWNILKIDDALQRWRHRKYLGYLRQQSWISEITSYRLDVNLLRCWIITTLRSPRLRCSLFLRDPLNLLHMYSLIYCWLESRGGKRRSRMFPRTISLISAALLALWSRREDGTRSARRWTRGEKKIQLHHNLWIHFCIIEFPCYSLMHVYDVHRVMEARKELQNKRNEARETWFMLEQHFINFKANRWT
jgi:hypothetical protein